MPLTALPDLQAPLAVWAQWYGAQHWPIFPCHGKAPLTTNGFHDASCDQAQIAAWWQHWPHANIGTPMGQGRYALDIDPRHGGDDTLFALERSYGSLPHTLLSHTGGGGDHLLFAEPPGGVRNKASIGPGIDVQGPGSYIILPPSIHPDTGKPYLWDLVDGPDDIDPVRAPDWLEALVAPTSWATHTPATSLAPAASIPEGQRESTLMRLIGAMQRQGASPESIRAALDAENQRCVPPLPATDLDRLARSVTRYPPVPVLDVPPAAPPGWPNNGTGPGSQVPPAWQATVPAWTAALFTFKSGELKQNAFNIGEILRNHPYWQQPDKALWYDVIRGYHMCGSEQISKALATQATRWFGGQMRLAISNIDLLKMCMEAEAGENQVDLLKQHLLGLKPWDGVKRLETWLIDVTGAEDTEYARYLSRGLPVAMVARVQHPGCPCRLVVILEGKENIGKSHLVEAIATPEWYTILSMSLEGKDSHIMLHKYWMAELAELDSLTRTEDARMKAFVTMETDTYVPKYSNVAVSIPRRTIFMGTTNDASGYLKGQSGNTRYYPLKVGDRVDVDLFRTMREQIFAEALVWHSAHPEDWWQEPPAVTMLANEARELRRQASDFEQPLHEWLAYTRFDTVLYEDNKPVTFTRNETSWPEIAQYFLKIDAPERWKDRSLQMQIANALKALGWVSSPVWRFGRTTRIWKLPG